MADDYPADTSTTGFLPMSGSVSGRIDSAGDTDWFRIDMMPGGAFLFDVRAADGSQPIIYVFDQTKNFVMYSNQLGLLNTYDLTTPFTWVDPHTYYVLVTSDHVTDYRLGVRQLSDDYANNTGGAQTLTPGGSAGARIEYAGDKDYFRFHVEAGHTYTVKLTGDAGSLPAGVALQAVTDAHYTTFVDVTDGGRTLTYRALSTQDVYFNVGTLSGATSAFNAPFHVSLSAVDSQSPRVNSVKGLVDGPLTVTFSEQVARGSGTISLLDDRSNVVLTWDVATATIAGNQLTVDPGRVVLPGQYTLRLDSGAVQDMAGHTLGPLDTKAAFSIYLTADGRHAVPFTWHDDIAHGDSVRTDDVAVLSGKPGDYEFANGVMYHYASATSADGKYLGMRDIERIMFTDSQDELALTLDGYLGKAYRLYQAAFDRTPDKGGLGYYLYHQQHGLSLEAMANNFLNSPEFISRYGANTSNADFVDSLYQNVLHRAGDTAGIAYHIANLEHGMSRAAVLTGFSESPENQAQVAQLIGEGFLYTPMG